MVIIVKDGTKEERIRDLIQWIESQNLRTHVSTGDYSTIIGVIGDTSKLDEDLINGLDIVEGVKRVSEPFKSANRKFHPQDSIIEVGDQKLKVGHGNFAMIAGPCSVESEEQLLQVASAVKASGATCLRGGAFKPRTSPYSFQGLENEGLRLLLEARRITGLPIVTEIMSETQLDDFADVDIIQVGARNMQNFRLLKALGHSRKPVLLKRGLSATIEELLMSAEYVLAGGNPNVILCDSLQSIEYWFLLHFEDTCRHFQDSAATERALKQYLPTYDKTRKYLEKDKWVKEMLAGSKMDKACELAEKYKGRDSYSEIYKAIKKVSQN